MSERSLPARQRLVSVGLAKGQRLVLMWLARSQLGDEWVGRKPWECARWRTVDATQRCGEGEERAWMRTRASCDPCSKWSSTVKEPRQQQLWIITEKRMKCGCRNSAIPYNKEEGSVREGSLTC